MMLAVTLALPHSKCPVEQLCTLCHIDIDVSGLEIDLFQWKETLRLMSLATKL